jgi:hypothetical protein
VFAQLIKLKPHLEDPYESISIGSIGSQPIPIAQRRGLRFCGEQGCKSPCLRARSVFLLMLIAQLVYFENLLIKLECVS